jgi:3-hydroxyisobutyrate dehydrogenase
MSALRAGIIGVGAMGGRIGARVHAAGDPIVAYDRDAERLAASGLPAAGSVGELVEQADVVLLSLPDSTVIEPVVLDGDGVLAHAR